MNIKKLVGGLFIVGMSGCSSMNNTESGALGGGVLGAGLGALVGAATGHAAAGAAIGAGAGAITGGLIGHSEDRAENKQKEAVAAWAAQHPPLGLPDIVQMTQQHISDELIIRQMETTRSIYNLRPEDISYLKSQGVSDRVIYVMQSRTSIAPFGLFMSSSPRRRHQWQSALASTAVAAGNSRWPPARSRRQLQNFKQQTPRLNSRGLLFSAARQFLRRSRIARLQSWRGCVFRLVYPSPKSQQLQPTLTPRRRRWWSKTSTGG